MNAIKERNARPEKKQKRKAQKRKSAIYEDKDRCRTSGARLRGEGRVGQAHSGVGKRRRVRREKRKIPSNV